MKLSNKLIVTTVASLGAFIALAMTNPVAKTVIGAQADATTLRIYSWEDYIYEQEDPEDEASIIDQFESYYETTHGTAITVEYNTFSTNEEMYNTVALGGQYDLLVPSDYMIQRLIAEDKIQTLDLTKIPNYTTYASEKLQNLFIDNGWDTYAAGYMWGTLGLLHNKEEVDTEDMNSWNVLWDDQYFKEIAVKDSMREGYLIGLLHVYYDELMDLKADYEASTIDVEAYNSQLSTILNRTDEATIKLVGDALKALKSNIYGTEVDQGKNDMVSGKININTAWSGDAVYAIYEAAEGGNDVLRYSIPEEGSNIWYDAFVMPKGANADLAHEFINFVSRPDIAVLNIDYIGYTSFIAGDSILEYILSYDEVVDETFVGETYEVDLSYFFDGTLEDYVLSDAVFNIDAEYKGGQLTTQYPSLDEINRSAVMMNFDAEANQRVTDMWAEFKATELQAWMFIVGGAILVIALGAGAYFFISKNKSSRNKRRAKRK